MRRILLLLAVLTTLLSCRRSDGIYAVEDGWDIVHNGKTYEYRCEPDGMYLYIDWNGKPHYTIDVSYNTEIYRRTVGRCCDYSCTTLKFLHKNKEGKYVYVANYFDFDGYLNNAKNISLSNDETEIVLKYEDFKDICSLLEKYTSR